MVTHPITNADYCCLTSLIDEDLLTTKIHDTAIKFVCLIYIGVNCDNLLFKNFFEQPLLELYKLIDSVLLPSFDVQQAGKLVLGKQHWFAASEDQRQRFITAFYDFLVKTYAEGILGFEQNKIQIKPEPAFSKDKRKALVGTELALANGDAVEVNYALREVDAVWKIYDVRIDGVSYVQNYRNQFGAEISALGLEAVIERLESGA